MPVRKQRKRIRSLIRNLSKENCQKQKPPNGGFILGLLMNVPGEFDSQISPDYFGISVSFEMVISG